MCKGSAGAISLTRAQRTLRLVRGFSVLRAVPLPSGSPGPGTSAAPGECRTQRHAAVAHADVDPCFGRDSATADHAAVRTRPGQRRFEHPLDRAMIASAVACMAQFRNNAFVLFCSMSWRARQFYCSAAAEADQLSWAPTNGVRRFRARRTTGVGHTCVSCRWPLHCPSGLAVGARFEEQSPRR